MPCSVDMSFNTDCVQEVILSWVATECVYGGAKLKGRGQGRKKSTSGSER